MNKQDNLLKNIILSAGVAIGGNLVLYNQDAYANKLNNIIEDKSMFMIEHTKKDEIISENFGSTRIFVYINDVSFGEFIWNSEKNQYLLYNHRDGEIPLKLEQGNTYKIALIDKMDNLSFDLSSLEKGFTPDMLTRIMNSNYHNENIEKIIPKVLKDLSDIISSTKLPLYESQYINFLEKSSQTMFVVYYDDKHKSYEVVGYDRVSTGNLKRGVKNVETPSMIIDRSVVASGDWQAAGTDAQGYGEKGSRVRYLGQFYITKDGKGVSNINLPNHREIHLAMHTTTPWGLTQLGNRMSEGCIRISRFMHSLYKATGIIDDLNGKYLIIWDIKNDKYIYNTVGDNT